MRADPRLEYLLIAPEADLRHVEVLTMTAWYHRNQALGLGHTFPIGAPWLEGSRCDHMLVSLPYPFGMNLEICNLPEGHVHFYWLLPITKAERDFKVEHGEEALEQLFEERGIEYWNPGRSSLV